MYRYGWENSGKMKMVKKYVICGHGELRCEVPHTRLAKDRRAWKEWKGNFYRSGYENAIDILGKKEYAGFYATFYI